MQNAEATVDSSAETLLLSGREAGQSEEELNSDTETQTFFASGTSGFSSTSTASHTGDQFVFSDNDDLGFTVDPYGETAFLDVSGDEIKASHARHARASSSPLVFGMVLGNQYRLISIAGTGKMGEVWKAFDSIGQRVVALKFVSRDIDNYESAVLKAKRSFSATHDLSHQYICPTHAVLEDEKYGYFLVMKWMPNTLDQMLEELPATPQGAKLSMPAIRLILSNLADALDYIHSQNIIHRDIKPANVAITRKKDGTLESASLIDFGLAVSLENRSGDQESEGQISGTPGYMPPEQWSSERQTTQSDQYAFAATAYELFSGRRVFVGKTFDELRDRVLHAPPQPILGLPSHINEALLRALSKKPYERHASCRAFVDALYPPKKKTNWLLPLILLMVIIAAIPIKVTLFKKNEAKPPEKHELYEPLLKAARQEPLAFRLDEGSKSVRVTPPFPAPPEQTEEKIIHIGTEQFGPEENRQGNGWQWSWSAEQKRGTLTLTNYQSGPVAVLGVATTLVLPPETSNAISKTDGVEDALFIDGDLTIQGGPRSSLTLSGGLWVRGKVDFTDSSGVKVTSSVDVMNDVTHAVMPDPAVSTGPVFILNENRIDFLVDSEASLLAALDCHARNKNILITGDLTTGPLSEGQRSSNACFLVRGGEYVTLLSSGNHSIIKGKETDPTCMMFRIEGALALGAKPGMGSATLILDGGSRLEAPLPGDAQVADGLKQLKCETKGKKVYQIQEYKPIQPSKNVLVTVRGKLNIFENVCLQNNINVNYFASFNPRVTSSPAYVGGIFVDKMGNLEINGGRIVHCQGPLTGAINSSGYVHLADGVIEENCCYCCGNQTVEGGGLRVQNGLFVMSGGEICNNLALANISGQEGTDDAKGGGIHGSTGSDMNLTGGRISGNISLWGGGGIYVGGMGESRLSLANSVEISENAATLGAGLYIRANVFMRGGCIAGNHSLAKISALLPRGAGVYIKEWNSSNYLGRGPVLALSGTAFIDPDNPIFICSNVATGPPNGPFVYVPIQVVGPLTDNRQKFVFSIGSAAAMLDDTIRLVAFRGNDFAQSADLLSTQFDKFEFGFWGATTDVNNDLKLLPNPEMKSDKKNKTADDLVHYFLELKERKE
ncbi:MAG: serine/threonine-protein kinase [Planctomycetia bacterium]|nr:serine/threonine-protein kinase [Planctomycetia bacterium]